VVWRIALVAGAVGCCLALPPRIGLHPALASALAVVVAGAAAALWPRGARWPRRPSLAPPRRGAGRWVRWSGVALLWAAIAWCVVSQVAPLTEPRSLVWSLRGLPLVLVAGVWVWPQLSQRWQRRALAAMVLPTGIALALVAWSSPPHPLDFQPYYVAVDGHGTLYVSDAGSPVIRVFAPDGTLRAKLRPGVASNQGIPGPGFMPPGPYNDPDGLGVPRATPGTGTVSATLRPYPFGADDFWFCGLAVGTHDRLYVPDWMRGRMLRFAPDGRLEARWPLPNGYHPSLGCVATAGNDVLLSDEHGTIVRLDATGRELARWTLPERSTGGISVAPDGTTLFALALTRVYRLNLASGATSSWALPAPSGPLGNPYQAILAASGDRLFITDLGQHRVDVYRTDGQSEGVWGGPGVWPGQFGQVGGLARDAAGLIYVADFDHRVVQRFTGSGEIDALYRSPDDDEFD
jgi:hypothetical protein